MNEGETGLIQDFSKEKQNESTMADYFNFHLDEEKWIKILNHSILVHYERHIIEKKLAQMSNNNNLNNTNYVNANPQIVNPMYYPIYLQNPNNYKNFPIQYGMAKQN